MTIKTASLPDEVASIINHKNTEPPYSGEYNDFEDSGTYLCRQCGLPLFRSQTKFHSGCGWPSFDSEIAEHILRKPDADGMRTEILCQRCEGHLGHEFMGEGFTARNIRHCVNSLSLDFVANLSVVDTEEAIFAAGCFWGVEHYFKQLSGVLKTEVGYTGGKLKHPTYEQVCSGATGHYEAIRVVYDPSIMSYEQLTKYFFEIHDPTQTNGQGPDLGPQYLSAVFYYNEEQKKIAQQVISQLKTLGYEVATAVLPVSVFWRAEKYHQQYYDKTKGQPYCHHYEKKFD